MTISAAMAGIARPAPRNRMPWIFVVINLTLIRYADSQTLSTTTGLLGEYFTDFRDSCEPNGNGSMYTLRGRVPNISRNDKAIYFTDRLLFKLEKCIWDRKLDYTLKFNCRGNDRQVDSFGARWTGYIQIQEAGYYNFEMEADDGARIIIGNNNCPGFLCGSWDDVMNFDPSSVTPTYAKDNTKGALCDLCIANSVQSQCWVSPQGCEPFRLWMLELDSGLSGIGCASGLSKTNGTRWLNRGLTPIRIEYFNRGGEALMTLRWKGPDSRNKMSRLPETAFRFPDHRGLTAEWYLIDRKDKKLPEFESMGANLLNARYMNTTTDKWQENGPGEGAFTRTLEAAQQSVMVRWHGYFTIEIGGLYKFRVENDDGGRVIFGGRGTQGDRLVVDNDGMKGEARAKTRQVPLLPGLHPIRIEYFWQAPHYTDERPSALAVRRPPGMSVKYSGPDTGAEETVDVFLNIGRDDARYLVTNDYGCLTRNFEWSRGMFQSRDCAGRCFDNYEVIVGDYVCDDGITQNSQLSTCPEWLYDNDDCEARPGLQKTTPKPRQECFVSPSSGGFRWHNIESCSRINRTAGLCRKASTCEDLDENLCKMQGALCEWVVLNNDTLEGECQLRGDEFASCCSAKFYDVNFWGSECLAFGAPYGSNCTYELKLLLAQKNKEPESIATRSMRNWWDPDPPEITAMLMGDCEHDICNHIITEYPPFVKPRLGTPAPTLPRICPPAESEEPGLQCWEGPWDVAQITDTQQGLKDPFTECQDFQYNFCKNRKTWDGRPFKRCCVFVYVNSGGSAKCMFKGLPNGVCENWIQLFQEESRASPYTAISNALTLQDCADKELCNDPLDKDYGCPDSVIEEPPETRGNVVEERDTVQDIDKLLEGAPEPPPPEPPWATIFTIVGGVILACLIIAILAYLSIVPEEPLWHSRKAKVIADDTFIEPQQDGMLDKIDELPGNGQFGCVKPRPNGLAQILEESRFKVKALQNKKDPIEMTSVQPDMLALPSPIREKHDASSISPETRLALPATSGDEPHLALQLVRDAGKEALSPPSSPGASSRRSHQIARGNRLLPGQLPGQILSDSEEDHAAAKRAVIASSPIGNAEALGSKLHPDHSGPAAQANLFQSAAPPIGEYALEARQQLRYKPQGVSGQYQTSCPPQAARLMRESGGIKPLVVAT